MVAAADGQNNRISGGGGLQLAKDDNSLASESSGFGSLTKKRAAGTGSAAEVVVGLGVVESGTMEQQQQPQPLRSADAMVESMASATSDTLMVIQPGGGWSASSTTTTTTATATTLPDHGHSRNSSNTSQVRLQG